MVTIKIYLLKCLFFLAVWYNPFLCDCFSLSPGEGVMLSCFNPDHSLSLSQTEEEFFRKRRSRGGESFFAVYYHKYKDQTGKNHVMSQYHCNYSIFLSPTTQTPQLLSANQRLFTLDQLKNCSGVKFFHCQENTFKEDMYTYINITV